MKFIMMAASLLALSVSFAAAADQPAGKDAADRQQMIETHQKMADLHQKAVECLKSGKDVSECQDAMAKECPMAKSGACPFKKQGCSKCGKGGMKGHGRGMKADGSTP